MMTEQASLKLKPVPKPRKPAPGPPPPPPNETITTGVLPLPPRMMTTTVGDSGDEPKKVKSINPAPIAPVKVPKREVPPKVSKPSIGSKGALMIYGVAPELRQRLKAAAYGTGCTMRQVIVTMIEQFVIKFETTRGSK